LRFRPFGCEITEEKGNERMKRTYISAVTGTFLGFILLLSACATVPKEADLKESLSSAASLYWKMRMDGKVEETFKMEDEEILAKGNKAKEPLFEYYKPRAKIADTVHSFSIKRVQVTDDNGRVDVEFSFSLAQVPRPVHQTLTDEWVFKGGQWLHKFPLN